MEANQTSMKWKRPSPGISTRSESQIHLLPNHSGQARYSDSHAKLPSSEPNPKRPRPVDLIIEESPDGNALIKDLRVKRVFSPASNHRELGIKLGSDEHENGPKAAKNEGVDNSENGFSCSGRAMVDSGSKGTEKSEMGFVFETPKSPAREGINGRSSDEEQKSSPDAKENGVRLNVDRNETKPVLKPRQRVFKAPGSFSYRRLLPYLQDIAKDNSCLLDFCQNPNGVKGLGGKSLQGMRENKTGSVHQFNEQNLPREFHTSSSSTLLETLQVGNDPSSESPDYVPKSPSRTVVDECLSKPPVDGQIEKVDLGSSCKVQKLNVSDPLSSSAMDDFRVNKDHAIDMCTDGSAVVENVGTANKAGNGISDVAKHVKDINSKSSSIRDECYACKDNEVGQHYGNSNQSQSEGMRKLDMGCPCKDPNPRSINEQRVAHADEIVNQSQTDDSNEESVQMTPPDAEILGKLEVKVKRISREGYAVHSTEQGLRKPSTGFNHINASRADVKMQESSPKTKMVLNPCSRLKLFRSPGSVSYRRLLPFLMDMEKNTCTNTDKDLERRQLPPLTPNQQETPMNKSSGLSSHPENHICDPATPQSHVAYNDGVQNLTSPQQVNEFQMSFDLQKEQHVEQDVSGKQTKLETSPDIVNSGLETDPPVILLRPSACEATSTKDEALSVTNPLSDYPKEDYISSSTALANGGKPVHANSLCQNSSQIDTTVSSGIHAAGLRKGILKRNPRGCRGLCSCLNCASFRLHAERAFEFSRNQMQDAEEVALNLMKELSNLRKIFELSAVGTTNHIMNSDEVKEACRKASEAEDLARNRLGEMNQDLNIHCRITCLHEPKVTFANYIEEKVIPKAKFSTS